MRTQPLRFDDFKQMSSQASSEESACHRRGRIVASGLLATSAISLFFNSIVNSDPKPRFIPLAASVFFSITARVLWNDRKYCQYLYRAQTVMGIGIGLLGAWATSALPKKEQGSVMGFIGGLTLANWVVFPPCNKYLDAPQCPSLKQVSKIFKTLHQNYGVRAVASTMFAIMAIGAYLSPGENHNMRFVTYPITSLLGMASVCVWRRTIKTSQAIGGGAVVFVGAMLNAYSHVSRKEHTLYSEGHDIMNLFITTILGTVLALSTGPKRKEH